jgi:hypothetical protein
MYVYKWRQELFLALAQGFIVFLVEVFGVGFRPEEISDWGTWRMVVAGALSRSLVAAIAGAFGKATLAKPERPKRRRPRRDRDDEDEQDDEAPVLGIHGERD